MLDVAVDGEHKCLSNPIDAQIFSTQPYTFVDFNRIKDTLTDLSRCLKN